jgi:predicted RND superfamily exporter protein
VIIDTGKPQGLYEPDLTQRLERSSESLLSMGSDEIWIGNVNGIHTVLREVNRALHGNDQNYYRVPDGRELTAQELLLFEVSNADDLHRLVSEDYAKARVTAMVPFVDAIHIKPVVQQVRQHFEKLYPDMDVYLTGIGGMLVETIYDLLTTMIKSYGIALISITGLMILIIGRLRIGLISMAPNLLPIALAMGVMGWMGMSFDFSNMMVGSVAIGLVVDDTIHFLHNLRRSFDRLGDVKAAIRETLHTAGRAIFITSMVLAAGMAIAITAELQSTANFGIITASAILLALLADFFLVPALMYAVFGKQSELDQGAAPGCNTA